MSQSPKPSRRSRSKGPAAASSEPAESVTDASPPVAPEPVNLDLTGLPPLEYPGFSRTEAEEKAQQERRRRLRVEVAGGAVLALFGLGGALATHNGNILPLAVLAVLAIVAYEFLVSSFE
jgi:hypothetical protein